MRDYQILLEPFDYVALLELSVTRQVNEHVQAYISIRIQEDKSQEYLQQLMDETWVKIKAVGEKGEQRILFYGIVKDFTIHSKQYETILKLDLAGGTYLMDRKEHFRTFQQEDIPHQEVCDVINQGYQNVDFTLGEGGGNESGYLLIQHRETDWNFLKRVASRANNFFIADADIKGISYCLGMPSGVTRALEEGCELKLTTDVGEYLKKKESGVDGIHRSDFVNLVFDSREIYDMGDRIKYAGKSYIISKICTNYQGAECIHIYHLTGSSSLKTIPVPSPQGAGRSFHAVVKDIKRDKVRIDVNGDEYNSQPQRKWFVYSTVYSTPDGTGWYVMPEKGDQVQLHIPGSEDDGFVISSVHLDTSGGRQNPDHKSFKNKYGKEILFTPEALIMTNNKGLKIMLSDQDGIYIESDKNISVRAEDMLTVSSNESSLLFSAKDKLQFAQGSTGMTMDEEISFAGGAFRIQ